jgi:hypothetical protein
VPTADISDGSNAECDGHRQSFRLWFWAETAFAMTSTRPAASDAESNRTALARTTKPSASSSFANGR